IVSLPSASTLAILRRDTRGRPRAAKLMAVVADPVFSADDERLKGRQAQSGAGLRAVPLADNPNAAQEHDAPVALTLARGFDQSAADTGLLRVGTHVPRLPGTRREAELILALAPPDARREALDFAASRAAVSSAELGQYAYVHFATHGLLNSLHPELSGILL